MDDSKQKIRSYWHIDAKWITALIFTPVFILTMLIANLYIMTQKDNAVKVSRTALEAMLIPSGSMSGEEIIQIRKAIHKSPNKVLRPFPGTDITITEADLDTYKPEEIKQKVFNQLAITLYDGSSSFSPTGTLKESFGKLGLMAIFTKEVHAEIKNILKYATIISALLLIILVYFSYGFGRMISPGIIFIVVGLPAILITTALQHQPALFPMLSTGEISLQQRISEFVSTVGPTIAEIFLKNYIILTLTGVVLVIGGIIGGIIQKIIAKIKTSKHP